MPSRIRAHPAPTLRSKSGKSPATTPAARTRPTEATPEAIEAAKKAGLRYVSDEKPGITRVNTGKTFTFRDTQGKAIHDPEVVQRVRHLAIPPAWTSVWICPLANGHIQATGRDARGRKQYRYHEEWRATRDANKFERMIAFGEALPAIRRRVSRDLRLPGIPRDKVLAAMVRLLETTLIRVGNEEYARTNRSYGLSTLRDRHVKIKKGSLHFHFKGKSGKTHSIDLHDPKLASIVEQTQDLPGQDLFQYLDESNRPQKIASEDVNDYLHAIAGDGFSAKDFRTWAGTVVAAMFLQKCALVADAKPTKKNLLAAIEYVSQQLGNTPAICRKSYIHPAVMDGYLIGETIQVTRMPGAPRPRSGIRLRTEEKAVLAFLKRALKKPKASITTLLKRSLKQNRKKS